MKILVTGATGFIGHHLIDALLMTGHNVVATSTDRSKAVGYDWFKEVNYVEYRMSTHKDPRNLFEYFERPDAVIHLAWSGLPDFKALRHVDTELFAQLHFVENLVRNGLTDITVTGTCLEYGMQSGCLTEDTETHPTTAYGVAKDTLRKYIELLTGQYTFSFKWTRLFYMYGEGQHPNSIIPQLETALKNGDEEFRMSGGVQVRDYLEIGSVTKRIIAIALQNNVIGVVNCCSGLPISVGNFVRQYLTKSGRNIEFNLGHYAYPDYEPMEFWGDVRKLNKIRKS